jgi:hypothetical protein
MEWQFGYNCIHYLPTIRKCRILIDAYRTRKELTTLKWFDTKDLLVYINTPTDTIIELISSKIIRVKPQKKATTFKFGIFVASQYDDCYLATNGGKCLHFAPHSGRHITRTMDLAEMRDTLHPNLASVPTDQDVAAFEDAVRQHLSNSAKA